MNAQLVLNIDGDNYLVELLPRGPSRQRMRISLWNSNSRRYVLEEIASGAVFCECKGFAFAGHCKHADAARAVGLVGLREEATV